MNGELMNMLRLTIAANYFLKKGLTATSLLGGKQIERYEFDFAAREAAFIPARRVEKPEEWLAELKARGASDCKLIAADEVDDYSRLMMPNKLPCCIICFYEDGGVSTWNRFWGVDDETGLWIVLYQEQVIGNPPAGKPRFQDVSQDMGKLLERCRVLAQQLGLSDFAFRFRVAHKSLQANLVGGDGVMQPVHRRLLQAAMDAYVFDGGENSWLVKGRLTAQAKGREEEFDALTKDLYRGIVLCCMYAANELNF